MTLNYSGTVTFETLHDVTEMMSAAEWLDYARLAKYNAGSYASATPTYCLLYTSDAADDLLCVDLGGRRIIKKTKQT